MTGASLVTIPETIAGHISAPCSSPVVSTAFENRDNRNGETFVSPGNVIFPESSPDFLRGFLIYNAFIVKHK